MWTIILGFLKNPKNILILILVVGLLILALVAFFYKSRTDSLAGKLQSAEITAQAQAEIIEQNARLITAIKNSQERMQAISAKTDDLSKQIAGIKIEGRCIKDEAFYNTADNITSRFNGLQPKGSR